MTLLELEENLERGCTLICTSDSIKVGITSLGHPEAGIDNISIRYEGSDFQNFQYPQEALENCRIRGRLLKEMIHEFKVEPLCYY